jgi:hypothetical protein
MSRREPAAGFLVVARTLDDAPRHLEDADVA